MSDRKLWRVRVRTRSDYGIAYVLAPNPAIAYDTYRAFMDAEDVCFRHERALDCVELIAEAERYPECGARFFEAGPRGKRDTPDEAIARMVAQMDPKEAPKE